MAAGKFKDFPVHRCATCGLRRKSDEGHMSHRGSHIKPVLEPLGLGTGGGCETRCQRVPSAEYRYLMSFSSGFCSAAVRFCRDAVAFGAMF